MSADIFFGTLASESATTVEDFFATGVDGNARKIYHKSLRTKLRREPAPTVNEEISSSLNLWPALLRQNKTTDLTSDGTNSQRDLERKCCVLMFYCCRCHSAPGKSLTDHSISSLTR